MRRIAVLLCTLSMAGMAQASALPLWKSIADGHKLPRPYGVGIDFFEMKQGYEISSLKFSLPGSPNGFSIPTSLVDVNNRVHHHDLKLDAWVLPFVNVFASYGQVHASTKVNLSKINLSALGLPALNTVNLSYDGSVYGIGSTIAVGGDHWFASATGTATKTSLSGDFASTESSRSWQARVGLVRGPWSAWVGGQKIDVRENHKGTIVLAPNFPPVTFDVSLQQGATWTPTIGARYVISDAFNLTAEYGGGDRKTALVNGEWRFGDN
jgi:hypothetical protein